MVRFRRVLRDIALERIEKLLKLAYDRARSGLVEDSKRYVDIALKISSKSKVRIRRAWKRLICKKCHVMLVPGVTARVRIRSEGKGSRVTVTCLNCGWIKRYPIKLRRSRGEKVEKAKGDSSTATSRR